jgi:glycosyltransferase involved in cell wall biosynthesis
MQCGVPVIGSNSSSLPEVIGDAGWTLDPNDPAGIAQAVVELYDNATLRAEMSARSLARAAHFSWERCTRETIEVYRAVLDG